MTQVLATDFHLAGQVRPPRGTGYQPDHVARMPRQGEKSAFPKPEDPVGVWVWWEVHPPRVTSTRPSHGWGPPKLTGVDALNEVVWIVVMLLK